MTDELVGILAIFISAMASGRLILKKKEIKAPKQIDYPAAFSVSLLTAYILYDTFIQTLKNVSLTYLRGLEIAELKEEDMPMI